LSSKPNSNLISLAASSLSAVDTYDITMRGYLLENPLVEATYTFPIKIVKCKVTLMTQTTLSVSYTLTNSEIQVLFGVTLTPACGYALTTTPTIPSLYSNIVKWN